MKHSSPILASSGSFVVPRTPELNRLLTALEHGRSALIIGDAGTGKTHLVSAAAEDLRKKMPGFRMLSVQVPPAGDLIAALAPVLSRQRRSDDVATIVADVLASVRRQGTPQDTVLRVEDAQLLNDESAQALAWLVQQGEIRLVATMRRSAASEPPWYGLWKNDTAERIDTKPFTEAQVRHFLEGELGGTVTADTAWRMWRASAGNAFHLRELLRAQQEAGSLTVRDGVWVADAGPGRDERLRDVAQHEWSMLDAKARRAVATLSLAGPLRISVLRGQVDAETLRLLDHRGLVTTLSLPHAPGASETQVDVVHERFARVLLELVSHDERRGLLSNLMPFRDASSAALVRRVVNSLDCGVEIGLKTIEAAVGAALESHDGDTVVRITDLALAGDPDPMMAARLLAHRSDGWRDLDDPVRSLDDLVAASRLLLDEVAEDPEIGEEVAGQLLAIAERQANLHQFFENDVDGALRIVSELSERVLARVPPERRARWQQLVAVSHLRRRGYAGRHDEVNDECVEMLVRPADLSVVVGLVAPTAMGMALRGQGAEALELCERYLDVSRVYDIGHRWVHVEIALVRYVVQVLHGAPEEASLGFTTTVDMATMDRTNVHLVRGLAAISHGAWSTGQRELRTAIVAYSVVDTTGLAAFALYAHALCVAAVGDRTAARSALDYASLHPLRSSTVLFPYLRLLRLDTLLWLRSADAVDTAAELAAACRREGYARIELEALHRTVDRTGRTPVPAEVLGRIEELGLRVTGPRARALVRHVKALAAGDAAVLELAEAELGEHGLWLPPPEESSVAPLTRREREIAALAASGMTSKVIAGRLVLSVRTVDSHLSRVFAKTGVHSRKDLARVIR